MMFVLADSCVCKDRKALKSIYQTIDDAAKRSISCQYTSCDWRIRRVSATGNLFALVGKPTAD